MTARGWLLVTRPPLLIGGLIGPLAIVYWLGELGTLVGILAVLGVAIAHDGFMMLNEYMDYETDRLKYKRIKVRWVIKPIPAGLVDRAKVGKAAFGAIALGTAICIWVSLAKWSWEMIALASLAVLTGSVYNFFKQRALFGNFCVALCYGFTFVYLGYVGGDPQVMIPIAVAFGLYLFSHNFFVQYQDSKVDKRVGLRTLGTLALPKPRRYLLGIPIGLVPAFLSAYLFYRTKLPLLPAWSFSAMALCVFIAFFTIGSEPDSPLVQSTAEWVVRRADRLLLLLGFVLLLIVA